MRRALEGGKINRDDPARIQWEEFTLAKTFGWTPAQIDECPGDWYDWAVEFIRLERELNGHG